MSNESTWIVTLQYLVVAREQGEALDKVGQYATGQDVSGVTPILKEVGPNGDQRW